MKRVVIGMAVFCCIMASSGATWCGDNGNGTVTVNGLVWLKDAGCLGTMTWVAANTRAASLANGQCGLSDKSAAGIWRVPSIDELKAIHSSMNQFSNVAGNYWSSTTFPYDTTNAWLVLMGNGGGPSYDRKTSSFGVWPVRSGK